MIFFVDQVARSFHLEIMFWPKLRKTRSWLTQVHFLTSIKWSQCLHKKHMSAFLENDITIVLKAPKTIRIEKHKGTRKILGEGWFFGCRWWSTNVILFQVSTLRQEGKMLFITDKKYIYGICNNLFLRILYFNRCFQKLRRRTRHFFRMKCVTSQLTVWSKSNATDKIMKIFSADQTQNKQPI